jgi:hypothetical protein
VFYAPGAQYLDNETFVFVSWNDGDTNNEKRMTFQKTNSVNLLQANYCNVVDCPGNLDAFLSSKRYQFNCLSCFRYSSLSHHCEHSHWYALDFLSIFTLFLTFTRVAPPTSNNTEPTSLTLEGTTTPEASSSSLQVTAISLLACCIVLLSV